MAETKSKPTKATRKPPLTDAERHKRFVEAAREAEAEEDPAAFDRVFSKVTERPKPKD